MRRVILRVLLVTLIVLPVAGGTGCGRPDLSKVDIDNPVLDEAWSAYSEAVETGVDETSLEEARLDLLREEENLKEYYLETGDNRNADIEAVIVWLTAETRKHSGDRLAADAGQNILPVAEQESIFDHIRPVLNGSLLAEQYIYAIAVSRSDPTWALAWFDKNTGDFTVDGPVMALRCSQGVWLITYVGHDVSAFPGLPPDLSDGLDAYTWLSDAAWVITQTESYVNAARLGEDYAVGRFYFDTGMRFAYVYLQYPRDTLGFRYQKTEHSGWALVEVDVLAAE